VKDARPLELKPDQVEKIYGVPPKTEKGKSYVLRAGKFGFFWAHPNYPKEKDIKRIDKKAVNQEELEKVKIENL
jgi:ssDNA-binding Zn-finger/Zn-ribbon topoisomerase 1